MASSEELVAATVLRQHYRAILSGGAARALETSYRAPIDLSNAAISARVSEARASLRRVVKDVLGDRAELHELVERIRADGDIALRMLRDDDPALTTRPDLLRGLEGIVRGDGSRPSFLIRHGLVDPSTSALGSWGSRLKESGQELPLAIANVGRVERAGRHVGTGVRVQRDVIATNRHVLQAIAVEDAGGGWRIDPAAAIDFGREYGGIASLSPRRIAGVLFVSPQRVFERHIDHGVLDLALLAVEPAPGAGPPLPLDASGDWDEAGREVFIVGYPGRPALDYEPTLVEQLFAGTFGYKRLAPGKLTSEPELPRSSHAHDATTLGGNSGSAVLVAGRETTLSGLHYGGRRGTKAVNWGHTFARVLGRVGGKGVGVERTLRETCAELGIAMIRPIDSLITP